jgi:hypothetical protein
VCVMVPIFVSTAGNKRKSVVAVAETGGSLPPPLKILQIFIIFVIIFKILLQIL